MFNYPELQKVGSLNVLTQGAEGAETHVVMLHGYGANAYDLWSLQYEIKTPHKAQWHFLEAPLELNLAPGYVGRAWFPLNEKAIDEAMRMGRPLDFSNIYPPGMDRARDKVLDYLARSKIDPKNLVLGGFSQGSMLALEVALQFPQAPKGLLLFSSSLANKMEWASKAAKFESFSFFQCHGEQDQILPFVQAEALRDCLIEAGWSSYWVEFRGGHEIPRKALEGASKYLLKICG